MRVERDKYNTHENLHLSTSQDSSSTITSASTSPLRSVKRMRSLSPRKSFYGALWKKPRSGSGKASLRQVALRRDRLEYSSNKMEEVGEDFRAIPLSNIADVQIEKNDPKTFYISFKNSTEKSLVFSSESEFKSQEWVFRLAIAAGLKNAVQLKQTFSSFRISNILKKDQGTLNNVEAAEMSPKSDGSSRSLSTQRVDIRIKSMQTLDPDRLIDIRRIAKNMNVSTTRVWSKNVTLHFKAMCKEKEKSERPKAYSAFKNKKNEEDLGNFEFEFSTHKDHPDPTTCASLTLYANVSTERSSFPIMIPLGSCEIPLQDIWNSSTKAVKIILRRDPMWLYLRVQSALSNACDEAALEDVWNEFSDTLFSLSLPESSLSNIKTIQKRKKRWRNFVLGNELASTKVSTMKTFQSCSTTQTVEYEASPVSREESLKAEQIRAQISETSFEKKKRTLTPKITGPPICSDMDILDCPPSRPGSDIDILPTRVSPMVQNRETTKNLNKKSSVESTTSVLQEEIKGVLIVTSGKGLARKSSAVVNLNPGQDWLPRVEKIVCLRFLFFFFFFFSFLSISHAFSVQSLVDTKRVKNYIFTT